MKKIKNAASHIQQQQQNLEQLLEYTYDIILLKETKRNHLDQILKECVIYAFKFKNQKKKIDQKQQTTTTNNY